MKMIEWDVTTKSYEVRAANGDRTRVTLPVKTVLGNDGKPKSVSVLTAKTKIRAAENPADMLTLCNGDNGLACYVFNYGFGLIAKSASRDLMLESYKKTHDSVPCVLRVERMIPEFVFKGREARGERKAATPFQAFCKQQLALYPNRTSEELVTLAGLVGIPVDEELETIEGENGEEATE